MSFSLQRWTCSVPEEEEEKKKEEGGGRGDRDSVCSVITSMTQRQRGRTGGVLIPGENVNNTITQRKMEAKV